MRSKELIELLEREVDIKRLVRKLAFDKDDLESAAASQPTLYLEAGRFRAQTLLNKIQLKTKLATVTSERSLKVRHKRDGATETAIKTRVLLDPVVQKYQKRFDHAEALYEFAEQFTEAWKQRLMCVAILQKIRNSEMSSELRSVKTEEEMEKLRKKARQARHRLEELEDDD